MIPGSVRRLLRRQRPRNANPGLEVFQGNRWVHVLPALMEGTRTAVEVGALHGDYTVRFAAHARQVHAFEPREDSAEILRQRVPANVTVHQLAVSDRAGSLTLWLPMRGGQSEPAAVGSRSSLEPDVNPEFERVPVEVAVQTLDSCDFAEVDFLMVEVEGHELAVLVGGDRTLARDRPTILVSAQSRFRADLPFEVERHLAARGYRGFFAEKGVLRPFSDFDPAVHQRLENAKWGHPGYIYVFLYVHRDRPEVLERLARVLTADEATLRDAAGDATA